MNKSELVRAVSERTNLAQKDVEAVLNSLVDTVGDVLGQGDAVQLVGFGTFQVKHTAARVGRNPRSGEEMQIPAKKLPSFKPGKQLKDRVG